MSLHTMTKDELIAMWEKIPGDAQIMFDLGDEYISVESAELMGELPTAENPDSPYAICLNAPADRYGEAEDGTRILEYWATELLRRTEA